MRLRNTMVFAVLAAIAGALPALAPAAAFGVSPIRLDLTSDSRTGVINVANDDTRKLYFQAKLMAWTQAEDGKDVYVDNNDLIFFPQIFTVDPAQTRIIRVGVKGPLPPRERAYRLFIEELPDPGDKAAAGGAQVSVRMRFGVPIFAGGGEAKPTVTKTSVSAEGVTATIRNDGDRQVRFDEVQLVADERVIGKVNGWYVFPGVSRDFLVPVDPKSCPVKGAVEVRALTEGKVTRGSVDPAALPCPG